MIHLFINPLANNKKSTYVEQVLKDCFTKEWSNESLNDFDIEKFKTYDITKIGDFKQVCSEIPEDDLIVVAGGDGTISSFANDVFEMHLKNKIFYYACGSGNDFYNDVKDYYKNGSTLQNLVPFNEFLESLPYVIVNGMKKYFLNGIGYGIDGYCCEEGDKIRANSDKKVNYTTIAIKGLLGGFKPVNATVDVDGEVTEYKKVWLAPSMLGRFYGGGMMIAPEQNRLNSERMVTCVVAHDLSIPRIVTIFPKIFKGKHVSHTKYVTIKEGHRVNVSFDVPQALQIDGETVSGVSSYSVVYE